MNQAAKEQQQQGDGGTSGQEGKSESRDNVVDADYEVVDEDQNADKK